MALDPLEGLSPTTRALLAKMKREGKLPPSRVVPINGHTLPVASDAAIERPIASDLRNMERLRDSLDGCLVFSTLGPLVWTGTHWRRDRDAGEALAHRLSAIMRRELAQLLAQRERSTSAVERTHLDAQIRELADAAAKAESRTKIDAALALLERELRVDMSELDTDPLLFNVTNGTLDLRDGTLRPHDPTDWITKCAPVAFDQSATCPRFLRFLAEVFADDAALVAYMKRLIGYCLTGKTSEHVLAVWHGVGANGKTTLVNIILALLGDYAGPLDVAVLEATYGRDSTRDALRFVGKRLLVASESGERMRLREGFVKQATGGDVLTARALYQEVFTFAPTHKLALVTNHRPGVDGTDAAIWRRIALVPFNESFLGERADRDLSDKLRTELPGILNWTLAGCLEWQMHGLQPPEAVLHATLTYRTDEDFIGQFASECIVPEAQAVTPWRHIHAAYEHWSAANGHRVLSGKMLNARLRERLGTKAFSTNGANQSVVLGFKCRA